MIIKSYEINKINTLKNRFILLHGKNEGLQDEITSSLLSKNKNSKILKYDEKEIIDNLNDFYDNVLNKSLFETSKVFIININHNSVLLYNFFYFYILFLIIL